MTSQQYYIIGLIIAAICFVSQFYQGFLNRDKKAWYKKISAVGWLVCLLAFSMIVVGWCGSQKSEVEKNQAHTSDSIKYAELYWRFDSLRNAFDGGLERTASKMSYEFGKGVGATIRNSDSNRVKILVNALSNKRELIHGIDSMQHKLDSISKSEDPFMTCTAITHQQSNDTFFIFPKFKNKGGAAAKKLTFNMYYLYGGTNYNYEYYRAISTVIDLEWAKDDENEFMKGTGTYMTNFIFDSAKYFQYIIMIGNYCGPFTPNDKPIPFNVSYTWNPETKKWGQHSNFGLINSAHLSKDLIYFRHYP